VLAFSGPVCDYHIKDSTHRFTSLVYVSNYLELNMNTVNFGELEDKLPMSFKVAFMYSALWFLLLLFLLFPKYGQ